MSDSGGIRSAPELARIAYELGAEGVPGISSYERRLPVADGCTPARILRRIAADIRDGLDPLGDAFCSLRSREDRRPMGATYTPASIIDAMTDWAASHAPLARVVDPGAGSGRFTLSAARRFPQAALVGVEIDPLAALVARANFAVAKLETRAVVLTRDYRSVKLDTIKGRTLFIGNPPYVRHHLIPARWKKWLTSEAEKHGVSASQLAGLHVHFFLATVAKSSPGDIGSFITSAEWLDVNYGSLVRELLLDGLGGLAVHVLDPTIMPFEGTATTGAITCFQSGSRPSSVRLRRVDKIRDLNSLGGGRVFGRERLSEAKRWTPLLRAAKKVPEGFVELGELCRVHRGAVTGANRVWITDSEDERLPSKLLYPSVTRGRELFEAGHFITSRKGLRRVIDLPADLAVLDTSDRRRVEKFLSKAKEAGAAEGYVARNRRAWWSIGLREPAPILATYMARRPPAFVRNLAEARHINIAHGIYPREKFSSAVLDALASVLRERVHVAQGRTYAGGLTKFEPREMERLLVPDLPDLRQYDGTPSEMGRRRT